MAADGRSIVDDLLLLNTEVSASKTKVPSNTSHQSRGRTEVS